VSAFSLMDMLGLTGLLLVNAFFVMAEYALVSARSTRLEEMERQGVRDAARARRMLREPERYIATTQVGMTMAGLGMGWVGEPAFAFVLDRVLGVPLRALGEPAAHSLSALTAFVLVTFLAVVLSELVPKSLTLDNPERIAVRLARPLEVLSRIGRPLVWLLERSAGLVARLLGASGSARRVAGYSVQELKLVVEAAQRSGTLEDSERVMLHAVFDFGDLRVREVMIPRTEMIAVPASSTIDEMIAIAIQHPYSKFPVYEGTSDQVIGIAHINDLMRARHGPGQVASVRGLMREALFVPESLRVQDLLARFRASRQHLAVVLDEYGGTAGLVTLEDLLEEIVGEVSDAFDRSSPSVKRLPDGSALVDGLMLIEDVNQALGLHLEDAHYDTLAGYMLGRLGRVARLGDEVEMHGMRLRVEAMDGRRIARLSVRPAAPAAAAEPTP
jgi:CBS domain containing-hemolysin-like protein